MNDASLLVAFPKIRVSSAKRTLIIVGIPLVSFILEIFLLDSPFYKGKIKPKQQIRRDKERGDLFAKAL